MITRYQPLGFHDYPLTSAHLHLKPTKEKERGQQSLWKDLHIMRQSTTGNPERIFCKLKQRKPANYHTNLLNTSSTLQEKHTQSGTIHSKVKHYLSPYCNLYRHLVLHYILQFCDSLKHSAWRTPLFLPHAISPTFDYHSSLCACKKLLIIFVFFENRVWTWL